MPLPAGGAGTVQCNSTWFLNLRQHQSSVLGALFEKTFKADNFSCLASPLNVRLAYPTASYLSPPGWTLDLPPACSSYSSLSWELASTSPFLWERCSHLNLWVCVIMINVFPLHLPCKLNESRDHACLHCLTKGLAYSTHSRNTLSVEWKHKCDVSDDGLRWRES